MEWGDRGSGRIAEGGESCANICIHVIAPGCTFPFIARFRLTEPTTHGLRNGRMVADDVGAFEGVVLEIVQLRSWCLNELESVVAKCGQAAPA